MIEKKDWSRILSRHRFKVLEQVFMVKPPDIFGFEILGLFEELKEIEMDGKKGEVKVTPGCCVLVQLDHRIGEFAEPDPKLKTALYNIMRVIKLLIGVGVIP